MNEVKQRAAFIYFSIGAFSQAEALFLEGGCDPREVCMHMYKCILTSSPDVKYTWDPLFVHV